ncbi:MAG TPA: hypothetical protein VK898_15910, partial [Chloroflexota bacterium]|nr:hypothetical protein [Chloroflexota bacterium]
PANGRESLAIPSHLQRNGDSADRPVRGGREVDDGAMHDGRPRRAHGLRVPGHERCQRDACG